MPASLEQIVGPVAVSRAGRRWRPRGAGELADAAAQCGGVAQPRAHSGAAVALLHRRVVLESPRSTGSAVPARAVVECSECNAPSSRAAPHYAPFRRRGDLLIEVPAYFSTKRLLARATALRLENA